jgi:type VI secretion system secreted protein Hcp
MAELVMDIPSIAGECTTKTSTLDLTGKISVTSMSFSNEIELEITTTNATRTMHTVKIGDIELNRPFDLASVPLVNAMITGFNLGTVNIYVLKPVNFGTSAMDAGSTSQEIFLTYTLYDTMVKSHAFNGDDGGAPTETLGLNFTKVVWTYKQQTGDAKLNGNLNAGYNLLSGKPDTTSVAPSAQK